jgi:hypothetical protein
MVEIYTGAENPLKWEEGNTRIHANTFPIINILLAVLHTSKTRKANWIGHILRRNCFLKQVTEGKFEGRI